MTPAERIASVFPGSRWLKGYIKGKLNTDPLFNKALGTLKHRKGRIIDLGCGLGLFALWLHEHGCLLPVLGCDLGHWKLEAGMQAAHRLGFKQIELVHQDLTETPLASASVICAFDVLHYLPLTRQNILVKSLAVAARNGTLVLIRTGVRGLGWRSTLTILEEIWTRVTGWIRGGEVNFPDLPPLIAAFEKEGCSVKAEPLWGKTPFSSYWLEVSCAPVSEGSSVALTEVSQNGEVSTIVGPQPSGVAPRMPAESRLGKCLFS